MPDVDSLTYDAALECYGGTVELDDSVVEVLVAGDQGADEDALARRIGEVLKWVSSDRRSILEYVVENLLELKNESWVDDDEESVTAEEFAKRLTLESVSLERDGSIELSFDDGDLFWGHLVVVRADGDRHLNYVDISG